MQEDGKANAAQLAGMCVGSRSSAATEDKHTPLLGFKKNTKPQIKTKLFKAQAFPEFLKLDLPRRWLFGINGNSRPRGDHGLSSPVLIAEGS